MTLDFNTAEEQYDGPSTDFSPIPDGTIVDTVLTIKPGGAGPDGALTQSQRSDAQYLQCEFTVTSGEFERRKFWSNLSVAGGSLDDIGQSKAGNISKRTIRALLESCYAIQPKDMSEPAKAARTLSSYMDLNNLLAKVEVGIETYNDKENNRLDMVITPSMPEYKQPLGPDGTVKARQATPTAQGTDSQPSPQPATDQSGGKPAWA